MLEMSMALPLRAGAQSLYSLELERMGILEVISDKALAAIMVVVVVCGGRVSWVRKPVCQTVDVAEATCRLITVFEVDKGRASQSFCITQKWKSRCYGFRLLLGW